MVPLSCGVSMLKGETDKNITNKIISDSVKCEEETTTGWNDGDHLGDGSNIRSAGQGGLL